MQSSDPDFRRRLAVVGKTAADFGMSDWSAIGLQTGTTDIIEGHPRLRRALSWEDPDVPDNAVSVLWDIVQRDPGNLSVIEQYMAATEYRQAGGGEPMAVENISTVRSQGRVITFRPGVFQVPEEPVDQSLVAVMMPFLPQFDPVFAAIRSASNRSGGHALRVSDIWDHSTIVQDVFSLIFRSQAVVCDFTGKNPNVFYEAGIAHTLGKLVVPITQHHDDIPFDVRHHRYVPYLNNGEGLRKLEGDLIAKLSTVVKPPF